jgi:hypothetical protein
MQMNASLSGIQGRVFSLSLMSGVSKPFSLQGAHFAACKNTLRWVSQQHPYWNYDILYHTL